MAAGCSVVLKPAPQTPFCALMLGELVRQAGWPAGALSIVPLPNEEADALICDDRLKLLSFTGSSRVGWQLKAKSGKKGVVLELGGNAAVIVHHDAQLEAAAERCCVGGFSYAGQSCISVQRILVHQHVYAEFTDLLVERVKELTIGDPLDETTDIGPMISESDAKRAESWIDEAVRGGAKLLCGGQRRGFNSESCRAYRNNTAYEGELRGNFCASGYSGAVPRFGRSIDAGQRLSLWFTSWDLHQRCSLDLSCVRATGGRRVDRE